MYIVQLAICIHTLNSEAFFLVDIVEYEEAKQKNLTEVAFHYNAITIQF